MKTKELTYKGEFISLNTIKSTTWHKYKKLKDTMSLKMLIMIKNAYLPKMKRIELEVKYRSRHDCDNLNYNSKIFVDQLVKLGKLPNDNRKYYTKVSFEYDKDLPNNTMKFILHYV